MDFEKVMKSAAEMVKDSVPSVKYLATSVMAWINQIFSPEKRTEWIHQSRTTAATAMKSVEEMIEKYAPAVGKLGREGMASIDRAFPPEVRIEMIRRYWPYAAAAVVVVVAVRLCRSGGGGGGGKTMKAPGRNYRMPRGTFESNPRGYFRDLRSGR